MVKRTRSLIALAVLIRTGALGLPLLVGCTPDFDEVWQVKDLRLLAIRADPPEVLLPVIALANPAALTFPSVRVDALAVDPRDPDGIVEWQVLACTPEEERCDEEAALVKQAYPPPSEGEWKRSRLDEIGFDFTLDAELALAGLEADLFKGFGGLPIVLELRIRGAEQVIGVKRLVYGVIDPSSKVPNKNPTLARITADDEPIPDPWILDKEQDVVLLPAPLDGSKEDYVVLTFSGASEDLEEYLSYSFFVTDGKLSHGRTGGRPSPFVVNKKVDDVTSEWTTPEEAGEGHVWVVLRDDRGGVDWRSLPYRVE